MEDIDVPFNEVHYVTIQQVGNVPVAKGDFQSLPTHVQTWIAQLVYKKSFLANVQTHILLIL